MIQFSAFEFFFADKTLRGSMYGSANVRTFMPKLLRLWKTGKLDLEGMITRRIQLEHVDSKSTPRHPQNHSNPPRLDYRSALMTQCKPLQ